MKALFTFILLFITLSAYNQIELRVDEVDEFTGSIQKATKYSNNVFKAEDRSVFLNISVTKIDTICSLNIYLTSDYLGCLSSYEGKMLIKLENGDIIECMQITDTDCDDYPSAAYIPIKRDEQENPNWWKLVNNNSVMLKTIPVEKIRIHGTEYYDDFIPNKRFSDFDPGKVLMLHLQKVE